jgi:hypothetical protein
MQRAVLPPRRRLRPAGVIGASLVVALVIGAAARLDDRGGEQNLVAVLADRERELARAREELCHLELRLEQFHRLTPLRQIADLKHSVERLERRIANVSRREDRLVAVKISCECIKNPVSCLETTK